MTNFIQRPVTSSHLVDPSLHRGWIKVTGLNLSKSNYGLHLFSAFSFSIATAYLTPAADVNKTPGRRNVRVECFSLLLNPLQNYVPNVTKKLSIKNPAW